MLRNTFLHLPGVGAKTEPRLWREGVLTWDDYEGLLSPQGHLFGHMASTDERLRLLELSRIALADGDAEFFASRLPTREHYRVATEFPEDTVFLDIETTGLSLYYDQITVVGVSRGLDYDFHISGRKDRSWTELLADAKCVVTFNGSLFDLKFLRKHFPGIPIPSAHVDLRFFGRRFGLSGPQKQVEQRIGLTRSDKIEDVRGAEAALLWFDYKAGRNTAGKRLVEYNRADVEGMKAILDAALDRLRPAVPVLNGVRFARSKKDSRSEPSIQVPKYRGRRGPAVNFKDLDAKAVISTVKVAGIDLTGSERRASGWCLLDGRRAETKRIHTDDEIVAAVLEANPTVVSIDSPLSLPTGRESVRDSDPGRTEFGITRECERTLRGRGVNVYPCLIPSMQALTARGIALATRLRAAGVPVIESYPGAAQDIMGIPRKRASLEQLKEGLKLFGISGQFLRQEVSHDELDAITSAIVGLFFWAGRYEALGNESEDYLIVPDLTSARRLDEAVIGISGPISAGKTTAADLIMKLHGFVYGRYSLVLEGILKDQGKPVTREEMQALGQSIHARLGQRWLNQRLLERLQGNRQLVVDGLRWPTDHAFWIERFGAAFFHVHIAASKEIRRSRYSLEGRSSDEFEVAIQHEVETGVPELERLAHVTIRNETSKRAFEDAVGSAVLAFKARRGD